MGTTKLLGGFVTVAELTPLAGKLYFTHSDSSTGGPELWVSDGTPLGTQQLVDLNPGQFSSEVRQMIVDPTGTRLLFQASDGVSGIELWSSDGTAAGTSLVKDIDAGPGSSQPRQLTNLNGKTCFIANDGIHGYELWVTDGTTAGTTLVIDIDGTSSSTGTTLEDGAVLAGELYFATNGPLGNELWKTDGTSAGTVPVADIDPLGNAKPGDMLAVGNQVFFSANVEASLGRELWVTDGTAAGTHLVHDFDPGPGDGLSAVSSAFSSLAGELLLGASDGTSGIELWKTDGVTTTQVLDINPGPAGSAPYWFTPFGAGQLLFSARVDGQGEDLWVTDGTSAGTSFQLSVDWMSTDSSTPKDMHAVGGDYFVFTADNGQLGRELYRWDRTSGVTLLGDLRPGPEGSDCRAFYTALVAGGWLTFFGADDGVHGQELWVTDGTPAGTQMLKDINPNGAGYNSMIGKQTESSIYFHQAHGRVYFAGDDGVNGIELWSTDGTPAGTAMLADLNPGVDFSGTPRSSGPSHFVALGDQLLFSATEYFSGTELYASDGTTAGTSLLFEFMPGTDSGKPTSLTAFQGKVIFYADYPGFGREPFVTDGSAAGTTLVRNIAQGSAGSDPNSGKSSMVFFPYKGYLYFSPDPGGIGRELWRTDLTWQGTKLFADVLPGTGSSAPNELTIAGDGNLYFQAYMGGALGSQILRTDGTPGNLTQIPFRTYGVGKFGTLLDFEAVNNGIVFTSVDEFGVELQFASGSVPSVTTLCSLTPEFGHEGGVLCDGDLFAVATDPLLGPELFALSPVGAYVNDLGMSASGVHLSATDPIEGGSITATVEDPLPLGLDLLLMSSHLGTPLGYATDPASALWLNPAGVTLLGLIHSPSWSTTLSIPSGAGLAGMQVNLQSWHLPTGSLTPTTSNGLQLVIGS